ncbi:hypothetical protein ES702_05969 [subsurface metagenome]
MTKKQALKLYEAKFWEKLTYRERAEFQLFTNRLCMPFHIFHKALEETLGRGVYTHEFAYSGHLKQEFLGKRQPPTLDEILNLIPKDKRIIIKIEKEAKVTDDPYACICPDDLKSGVDGYIHITPRDCLTEQADIDSERKRRKALQR